MSDRALTRRDLLKLAGVAPATAMAASALSSASTPGAQTPRVAIAARPPREPLRALTAAEADVLDAIAARLIPSDANDPGATEAMAVRYIDRALANALTDQREAYRVGLTALDRYSRESRGTPFLQLSPPDQDAILGDVDTGTAAGVNVGFLGGSAVFFALVRGHVWQGTFGDPVYGGNAGFVGWDLVGYPGVRTSVGPGEQRLDSPPARVRASAYDNPMFNKAVADAGPRTGGRDAD